MGLGFRFREEMAGTARRRGEAQERAFRFDLEVSGDSPLGLLTSVVADTRGQVTVEGLADAAPAEGTLELSPLFRKRLVYRLGWVGSDGRRYRFEGEKSVTLRRHVVGWTTLPGKIYDDTGAVWAEALLRFDLARQLGALVGSFRLSL